MLHDPIFEACHLKTCTGGMACLQCSVCLPGDYPWVKPCFWKQVNSSRYPCVKLTGTSRNRRSALSLPLEPGQFIQIPWGRLTGAPSNGRSPLSRGFCVLPFTGASDSRLLDNLQCFMKCIAYPPLSFLNIKRLYRVSRGALALSIFLYVDQGP